MTNILSNHGSPQDRGSADAYYGRGKCPHKMVNNVRVTTLTAEEIEAYNFGFDNEDDRKDWR